MSFLLNPLFINISAIYIIFLMHSRILTMVNSLRNRSFNINKYKINHKVLSMTAILLYILIFIFGLYFFRLYSMPRNIDLKVFYNVFRWINNYLFVDIIPLSFVVKLYCYSIVISCIIIITLITVRFHKHVLREIFKWFIFFAKNNYFHKSKRDRVFTYLMFVGKDDLISYYAMEFAVKLTSIQRKRNPLYNNIPSSYYYKQLSFYHYYKIIYFLFASNYYTIIKRIMPLIMIMYDCIFHDLVITHVFYYLLFYVPLMLIQKITTTCGTYAPYISNLLCTIYYQKEDCIYALPFNLKKILDNYIASDLLLNPDLGLNLEAEIHIENLSRFTPMPENRSLYINIDGELLHTMDNIKFFHIIEDDNGNPNKGQEWILLADKRKFLYD